MNPYRDWVGGLLVLVTILVFARPDLWNSAPPPKLRAMFIPGFDKQSCVVILRNGRVHHVFSGNEARAFADTLDTSQHALRWDLYNAADEYIAFKRRHLLADRQRQRSVVMPIAQRENGANFKDRWQGSNEKGSTMAWVANEKSRAHSRSVEPGYSIHSSRQD